MRNLTIRRRKAFAASLIKMKIYIEDYSSGKKLINNVPCTKIGDLKNGEEKTFCISENAAKVYVIADDLSKNYCNDFFEIPAGAEDVFLSGENILNPANGNAFRFDGISSEDVLRNRKKGTKKGITVLLIALAVGIIAGFIIGIIPLLTNNSLSTTKASPKDFTAEGMQITLTDEFSETSYENYTKCYVSNDITVLTIKEDFSLADGLEDYTIEQYGDIVLQNNGLTSLSLKNDFGLTYFDYTYETSVNITYYYFTVLYKANDAFWIVTFATEEENSAKYAPNFVEWAKNVKFSNQVSSQIV